MQGKTDTRIFLASSIELSEERRAFRELILEQNNAWHEQGAFLQVIGWENFNDAVSADGKQNDYNRAICDCDLFVMLYHTKVGQYTRVEFDHAFAQFEATGKPLIYVYYKNAPAAHTPSAADQQSRLDFERRLADIEHYPTYYDNIEGLQLHFLRQLYRLAGDGAIGFAPTGGAPPPGAPPPALTHLPVTVHAGRDAVVATGDGSIAAGPRGMVIGDNPSGNFNTGHQTVIERQMLVDTGGGAHVGGDVNVTGGNFVGRDQKGS
jgi:hypothetical protein